MPQAMGGNGTVGNSGYRGLAAGLSPVRHQAHQLSLLGRAAGEECARRRELARINSFVDAYNAVSLSHVLPLGADDLDKIAGDIRFRYARPGDSFRDMAGEGEGGQEAAPKDGEVVYADGEKVLCRRWNWRQDARSLVGEATASAIVTVQSNGWGDEQAAAEDLAALLRRHCGARVAIFEVSARSPRRILSARA